MRHSDRRRRALALGVLLVGLATMHPAGVHAATDTVNSCDETTLRGVISHAAASDTVTFGCSGTITLTSGGGGPITLSRNLTIDGSGSPGSVTISGGGSVQVLVVNSGVSVTLNDLTIANGSGSGGGIYNGGTLNVTNSTFSGNGMSSLSGGAAGGAIDNEGTLNVANSTFSGNSANFGVYSGSGGAIYNGGALSVANSTFSGNGTSSMSGSAAGGAIYNGGTLSVANSTFSGNSAFGSGRAGALTGSGGAIYSRGALSVVNSTFSGNSVGAAYGVAGLGGSIYSSGATVTLANTILARASGGECSGSIGDAGGNLADDASCGFTAPASINSAPGLAGSLGPLASNGGPTQTIALLPNSPAIGAGVAATCLSTGPTGVNNLDQRGQPRHADTRGTCDSGAYDTGGGAALFATSFEPGQPQPSWTDTVDGGGYPAGGLNNVVGICCGRPPEAGARREVAHTGSAALMFSGQDTNALNSYAYLKVFDLSAQPIRVGPGTVLSYWIYPQSARTSPVPLDGSNSSCVAIDLIFSDGSNLRDSAAVDQSGNRMHPASQCGHLTLDAWNRVSSTIGAAVAGRRIVRIDVGFDHAGSTGRYRGYLDDLSIQ